MAFCLVCSRKTSDNRKKLPHHRVISFSAIMIFTILLILSMIFGYRLPQSLVHSTRTMSSIENLKYTPYSIVQVTIPNNEAKILAKQLVEQKLSCCVNIVPKVLSIYEWKGKIEESEESLMIIKTRTNLVKELTEYVRSKHSYEVCEVISTPIQQGNPEYLKWMNSCLKEDKSDL